MNLNAAKVLACLALILPFGAEAAGQEAVVLPAGDGKPLVEMVCSQCHGLKPLFVYNGDDRKWEILVHEMVAFGTQVTPQERDAIMRYLKATFSAERTVTNPAAGRLPAGKGRDIMQAACGSCHGSSVITSKRADRAGWQTILGRHVSEERVKLSADQVEVLLEYLAVNFARTTAPKSPQASPK